MVLKVKANTILKTISIFSIKSSQNDVNRQTFKSTNKASKVVLLK